MGKGKRSKNVLTTAEQKTTAAFKLIQEQNATLKKSLKATQDELEEYRSKYHDADKNRAVESSRNQSSSKLEILKYIISAVCTGIGVNLLSSNDILPGGFLVALGCGLYAIIVWIDKR